MVRALLRRRRKTGCNAILEKVLEKAGLIVTTAYGTASFAIKVGYSVLAAGVVVFVAVLALTLGIA